MILTEENGIMIHKDRYRELLNYEDKVKREDEEWQRFLKMLHEGLPIPTDCIFKTVDNLYCYRNAYWVNPKDFFLGRKVRLFCETSTKKLYVSSDPTELMKPLTERSYAWNGIREGRYIILEEELT